MSPPPFVTGECSKLAAQQENPLPGCKRLSRYFPQCEKPGTRLNLQEQPVESLTCDMEVIRKPLSKRAIYWVAVKELELSYRNGCVYIYIFI